MDDAVGNTPEFLFHAATMRQLGVYDGFINTCPRIWGLTHREFIPDQVFLCRSPPHQLIKLGKFTTC